MDTAGSHVPAIEIEGIDFSLPSILDLLQVGLLLFEEALPDIWQEQVLITANNLPQNTIANTTFILDSGATSYIISDRTLFQEGNLRDYSKTIAWGNAGKLRAIGLGHITIELGSHKVFLSNCLYCPQLGVNLLAINKLDDNGIHVLFANNKAILYQNNGINKAQPLATAFRQGRLYALNIPIELILYTVDQDIQHLRIAHTS